MLLAALLAWASVVPSTASGQDPYDALRIEAVPPGGAADGTGDGRWTILLDGYIDALASNRLGALVAQQRITRAARNGELPRRMCTSILRVAA